MFRKNLPSDELFLNFSASSGCTVVSKTCAVTRTDDWANYILLGCKCTRLRTLASLLTLYLVTDMTRCPAPAWSRIRTHYLLYFCFLSFFFFVRQQSLDLSCVVTMSRVAIGRYCMATVPRRPTSFRVLWLQGPQFLVV